MSDTRITSTDYRHPRRPFPVRLYNLLAGILIKTGLLKPLQREKLMDQAARSCSLNDFGGEAVFDTALRVLLESAHREAELTAFGRLVLKERLKGMLVNRLRIEKYLQNRPAAAEKCLKRPLVISGLQRTGTTMLQRLLAQDSSLASLSSWEALNPVPLLDDPEADLLKRKKTAQTAERFLRYISPDFFAVHPVEVDSQEEEVLLLDHTFMSTVAESLMHVPSYASWLEEQDHQGAYNYMVRILKVLSDQKQRYRWVLKTPHHLEFLPELFQTFPGLKLIWTHRDPLKCLTSFFSMISHSRSVFSNNIDPQEIGRHWLRKTVRMVNRAMTYREKIGNEHFIDVHYPDMVQQPMEEIRKIYREQELSLSPETEAAMKKTIETSTKDRYGRHRYRLKDFGLDKQIIRERFAAYIDTFGIRMET